MTTKATIPQRVKAGIEWLDHVAPGWWERINLLSLDMSNPMVCVLAQVGGVSYNRVRQRWPMTHQTARSRAFEALHMKNDGGVGIMREYERMNTQWKRKIRELLKGIQHDS